MSAVITSSQALILYPDSDGKPMADNTRQARWIVILFGNLCALFRKAADVFVAADLLWYPVEGRADVRAAPDIMVVLGRRKGDRGSYRQWEEEGIPVTVAFEVLSPGNTVEEMADKLAFYDEHGVEEYYLYNPDSNRFLVYLRGQAALRRVWAARDFVSPRLGIRFDLSREEMKVFYPDGTPFLTFEEVKEAWEQAQQQRDDAVRQRDDAVRQRDDAVRQRDDSERRLQRLQELSRKVLVQQATPDEMHELQHLAGAGNSTESDNV
jgi:Uma2 family endonuclease